MTENQRLVLTGFDGHVFREMELPFDAFDPGGVLALSDCEVSLCDVCTASILHALDQGTAIVRATAPCRDCVYEVST